jgi:signal transduction histidine kinase/streptogramin lyase
VKFTSGLFILLAALALVPPARAGDSPFAVDVWNTDDRLGLPQNTVIALAQTHDGYLWLGTQNGLARFDGSAFTPFNVNNTPALPANVVSFLFEDGRNNLWLGTANGALAVIQNGAVKNIYAGNAASGKITAAFDDQNGAVWFVTDARRIFRWRDGALDLAPPVERGQREFLTYLAFHLVVPEKSGASWQLQNGRVERWRGETREKDFGAMPWGAAIVTAAIEDDAGNLVVGTRGAGVFWFDANGNCARITKDDGLSQDFVLSLAFDSEKNLWVGTDGGGLDRVRKKIFTAPAALAGGVAQSVAEDAAGGVWTAFNLHGLAYWLTNSVRQFDAPLNAWCVLADARGQVWAGTSGQGLFRLENGNFVPVPPAVPVGQKIFCLAPARDGKVFAGGENGLASFDGQRWNYFSVNNGLGGSAVRAVAEDANGTVWIGTESDGLFTLRDGKIAADASAPVKDVSVLLAGADGALWAGSFAHGLARRSPAGEWKTFSHAANGLANDDIGSLVEDGAGNLWIGSYEGLVRVEKKSVADVLSGVAKSLSCRTFLTREGSAGAQPAALRARDGRLFFPTIGGVVVVNPAGLKPNLVPPPVAIESVLVDGAEQNTNPLVAAWHGEIILKPENEQLEIRFASLNFSAPKNSAAGVRFKYRLEGRDKNWTDIGGERTAHFPKLSPGKFVFHVAACNEDGVWNHDGATLAVTVLPPLWRTPGFLVTAAVVLLGAIAGIVYLVSTAKLKRQLRVARQKELLEHERSRIARDLHDQIGANLTQVALLGEMAEADKELPAEVEQHAQQIYATARETTRALDEIVWQLNSSNDTLASLANYACKYAQDYFALAGVSFRAELPAVPAVPLPPEVRHNVFLAFKEAVNNVVKHAHATEARVKLEFAPDKFVFSVADNGRGLGDLTGKQLRNGLKNMTRRLTDVGGEFSIAPGENGGTVVKLTVPLKPE